MEQCFAEAWSYGFGVVAVDQQPSLLSRYVLANTGSKFAGRLSSEEDIQLMIDALLLHDVLGPEVLLRKLLPGQMYGQLLYAAGDDATWGRGHHCYTVPLPITGPCSAFMKTDGAPAWLTRKLKQALLNMLRIGIHRVRRQSLGPAVAQEAEDFLRRQLHPPMPVLPAKD